MKIGVVSDVHGNAPALVAALKLLEQERIEHLVMLGDLLSYGCRPLEVLEQMRAVAQRLPTHFLIGNHDLLYFELQRGEEGYIRQIPPWIQESARWTAARLGGELLERAFSWQHEWVHGDVLFTHANPFGPNDWTYLNGAVQRERAGTLLRQRGLRAGVFGHTHRRFDELTGGARLLNPGSLGQPRDGEGRSTVAILEEDRWRVLEVGYDVAAHRADVEHSGLSPATQREILKFHAGTLELGGQP